MGLENAARAHDATVMDIAGPPWASRLAAALDRRSPVLYGLLLVLFAGLFVAAACIMTLNVDEAWILLSSAHVFGVNVPITATYGKPTITTGGPHLLVHGLLARITMDVLTHRLVSLLVTAALVLTVFRTLRMTGETVGRALLGATLFVAAPGFILQASLAMGEIFAVLLLIATGVHWVCHGERSWRAAVTTGLLLGSACAARVNCAAAIPGLVVYAALFARRRDGIVARALLTSAVAAVVAGVSAILYYQAGHVASATSYLGAATGLDIAKPLGRFIQATRIGNEYLPFILLAGIVGGWLIQRTRGERDSEAASSPDVAGILLFLGLPMFAAWMALAPVPHLRYLWPALACIWFAGIILLLRVGRPARNGPARLALHGIVLTGSGYGLLTGIVILAQADSLITDYQAMGISPRLSIRPDQAFRAGANQRQLAAFVAAQPTSALFFTPFMESGYPVSYLSNRRINPVNALGGYGDRYIILTPIDYAIWRPDPRLAAWLTANTQPAFQRGNFVVVRVSAGAPMPPLSRFLIGQNDIF